MTRTVLKTNNGQDSIRYDVWLTGSLGPDEGSRGFADLILMMRHIVDQPDLVRAAVDCPVEVTFRHDGNCWTCQATCYGPRTPEDR